MPHHRQSGQWQQFLRDGVPQRHRPLEGRNLLAATQPGCIFFGNGKRRDVGQRSQNRMQCLKSIGTIVDLFEKSSEIDRSRPNGPTRLRRRCVICAAASSWRAISRPSERIYAPLPVVASNVAASAELLTRAEAVNVNFTRRHVHRLVIARQIIGPATGKLDC